MDRAEANKAIKNGVVAACFSGSITAVMVAIATFSNTSSGRFSTWNDPAMLADIVLIFACAFGIHKKSRTAAIFMLAYFIFAKIILTLETGKYTGMVMSLFFIYFYAKAVQGTIAYHRLERAENPDYKPPSKKFYYIGIPVLLIVVLLMGYGALTMTGAVPSTEVLPGAKVLRSNRQTLVENNIINVKDKIEYFYSDGLTSILEGGTVLTGDRVIIYYPDKSGKLEVYALWFDEIDEVKLEETGNFLNPSIYHALSYQRDLSLPLILTTESRGDVKFIEALRKKISKYRDKDGKPIAPVEVTEEDSNLNVKGQEEQSQAVPTNELETVNKYTPAKIFSDNNEAIVLIRAYDEQGNTVGFGSGFNIQETGTIVTNSHVIFSGGSNIDVKFPKHGTYNDTYIIGLSDVDTDLAVLGLGAKGLPTVNDSMPLAPPNVGDKIYAIGNPEGFVNTLSEGLISAKRTSDGVSYLQISAPISEGSSGGPVFNELGEVVGVTTLTMSEGQNLNFAVDINEIEKIEIFDEYMTLKDLIDYIKQKNSN